MKDCIFCKIVEDKNDPKLAETENLIAVKDIHPKADVHILIIPKRHIERPSEFNQNELGDLFVFANETAKNNNLSEGYKLLFNVGKKAGQEIDHVHLHLLGVKKAASIY